MINSQKPVFPAYPFSPIWHIDSLAKALHTSTPALLAVAERANDSYYSRPQRKKDGTTRECFDATPELKAIHEQIKMELLRQVRFPPYLMGGIADATTPRTHLTNAKVHTGARVLINGDISSFFPSTSAHVVFDIWNRFFGFSECVSRRLTALTTRHGSLPQGAKTSGYLANLAFWRTEGFLVSKLEASGLRYTRFVDDVTVSSPTALSKQSISSVICSIHGMVHKCSLELNRSKHTIRRLGQRMEVTGAIVGPRSPSISHERRHFLRAAINRLERKAVRGPLGIDDQDEWASLCGSVAHIGTLHQYEAAKLKARLMGIPR